MFPLELRGYISRMKQKRRGNVCMSQKEKSSKLEIWQVGKLHLERRMIKLKMLEERINVEMKAQICWARLCSSSIFSRLEARWLHPQFLCTSLQKCERQKPS